MSKLICRITQKKFVWLWLALSAMFTITIIMTGCGKSDGTDDADGSTPAKYFRYTKEGNVKDGEYIVIRGLNTKCDMKGNLKINLDDIWTKYQGKIVVPEQINGILVKELDFLSPVRGETLPGGIFSLDGKIEDPDSYCLQDSSKWREMVTELVLPKSIQTCKTILPNLNKVTVFSTIEDFSNKGKQILTICYSEASSPKPSFSAFLKPYDYLLERKYTFVFPETVKEIDLSSLPYQGFFHHRPNDGGYTRGYEDHCFWSLLANNFKEGHINYNLYIEVNCAQDAMFSWDKEEVTPDVGDNARKKKLSFAGEKYDSIDKLLSDLICEGVFVTVTCLNGKDTVMHNSSKMNDFQKVIKDVREKADKKQFSDGYTFDKCVAPELKKVFK